MALSLEKRLERAIKAAKRGNGKKRTRKKAGKKRSKKKSSGRRRLSAAERERRELAAVDRAIATQLAAQRKRELAEHAALEREFRNIDRASSKRRGSSKKRTSKPKKGKLTGKAKAAFLARMARGRSKAKRGRK